MGHFVSSSREREKRNRRDSRRDRREGQVRKRNKNESEETEEIKTFPLLLPATRIAGLAQLVASLQNVPISLIDITKTCLYNFDPLTPTFI